MYAFMVCPQRFSASRFHCIHVTLFIIIVNQKQVHNQEQKIKSCTVRCNILYVQEPA